ncbi:hypothetical protein OSTOST_26066 [Ostertagia ostertagi]
MLVDLGFLLVSLFCIHAQYQPPTTRYVVVITEPPRPPPPPPGPLPPAPPGPYNGPVMPPGPPSPDLPPYVPDFPTNEYVQESIVSCADTLDKMEKETRNKKNAKLFRKASKSLRKLRRFNFDKDTLRQVPGNVQRMNNARNMYKNKCQRRTSDASNYNQLDNQFADDNDDKEWYSPKNPKRVARVQSTMDAASQCIEDYCGY